MTCRAQATFPILNIIETLEYNLLDDTLSLSGIPTPQNQNAQIQSTRLHIEPNSEIPTPRQHNTLVKTI